MTRADWPGNMILFYTYKKEGWVHAPEIQWGVSNMQQFFEKCMLNVISKKKKKGKKTIIYL